MCVSLVFLLFQSITFYLSRLPGGVAPSLFLSFFLDLSLHRSLAVFSSSSLFFVLIVIRYRYIFVLSILSLRFQALVRWY